MIFSHGEYVRAVLELAKARPFDRARLSLGVAERRLGKLFGQRAAGGEEGENSRG